MAVFQGLLFNFNTISTYFNYLVQLEKCSTVFLEKSPEQLFLNHNYELVAQNSTLRERQRTENVRHDRIGSASTECADSAAGEGQGSESSRGLKTYNSNL